MPPIRRQKYKLISKVPNNSASFYKILAKQVSLHIINSRLALPIV